MRVLVVLLFLFYASPLLAQSSFWKSPHAYLGQKPVGDTPKIFALDLLMKKDTFAFDRVAWSDDGKEFYYPSSNTWFSSDPTKIRYYKFSNGKWNGPFVLNEHYYAPAFSMDGQTLYLEGRTSDTLHSVIFQSSRTAGGGWTAPEPFMRASFGLYDFMPTLSGVYYVGSNGTGGNRRDFSTYDFSTLTISGGDTIIKSIGAPINTPGFDGDFYVARDESYMILSAKETPTFECELWITFRRKDKSWTVPVSLGPLINNGVAHRWGQYVSPDGKYLFYSTGTSPANCHIYWVRFDKLLSRLRRESGL